jgi:ethanolamine utilization cobalamin adenosyltransferase
LSEFLCEEDARQAITDGEKIDTNAKTIITPAARDLGEAKDGFAR